MSYVEGRWPQNCDRSKPTDYFTRVKQKLVKICIFFIKRPAAPRGNPRVLNISEIRYKKLLKTSGSQILISALVPRSGLVQIFGVICKRWWAVYPISWQQSGVVVPCSGLPGNNVITKLWKLLWYGPSAPNRQNMLKVKDLWKLGEELKWNSPFLRQWLRSE